MNFREVCIWKTHGETKEVEFMGVFQKSKVVEQIKWGESISANIVAGPVAVIKVFGTLTEVPINELQFEQRKIEERSTLYTDDEEFTIPMKGPCQI